MIEFNIFMAVVGWLVGMVLILGFAGGPAEPVRAKDWAILLTWPVWVFPTLVRWLRGGYGG